MEIRVVTGSVGTTGTVRIQMIGPDEWTSPEILEGPFNSNTEVTLSKDIAFVHVS